MASDFPQSAQEAKEHIRRIRHDKGLGDGPDQVGNNAADLEAALQILSNDLYQTPTHFLLELIQNADDNSFDDEVPSLSISYSKGWVRVECNERGFAKKNVEAICRICQSTKTGRSKTAGFVGEKGIGFKAVFKVASSVWISSGYYAFRFDRDAHLGMIAPIWDEHVPPKLGSTTILLKLDKECDEDRILEELRSYDERSLLFLRRLRRLNLSITPGTLSMKKPFETRLCREGETSAAASTMILRRNGVNKHYFVWRHVAEKLPAETLRPGISSSEIVLAFPYTIEGDGAVCPVIENQHAYAFLPVRDAGFSFLLQADFLLSANRDDVHSDAQWNTKLASSAAGAYRNAVLHMGNLSNDMRYSWTEYLPVDKSQSEFFESLRLCILDEVIASKTMEAWTGRKTYPSQLVRAPERLCDSTGRPLAMREGNKYKYLAGGYPETSASKLHKLGVDHMHVELFYKEMTAILEPSPAKFLSAKPNEWHSSLARALVTMTRPPDVEELPVLPLRDGRWVSSGSQVYFPGGLSHTSVPEGIKIDVVDAEAAADRDRRALFVKFGVQYLTDSFVRSAIEETHVSSSQDMLRLPPVVSISHVEFLYRTRDTTKSYVPLSVQMASEEGRSRGGTLMYLPSDVPSAASRLLPRSRTSMYGFLHPAYAAIGRSEEDLWVDFLQKCLGVSIYPRLYDSAYNALESQTGSCIHDDFASIMQGFGDNTWLTVFRDGWEFYKEWLGGEHRSLGNHQHGWLKEYLRDSRVRCTGTSDRRRLCETYLLLGDLTVEYDGVTPFLDIPDAHDPRWMPVLECLGVGTSPSVEFYLDCLSGAKDNEKVPVYKIRNIMHKIEDYLEDGDTTQQLLARGKMADKKLVHIPANGGGRGTWVAPYQCFWRGAPWLTQSACLEKYYPGLEVLFRRHLSVQNASMDDYIHEARAIRQLQEPIMPHIRKILVALAIQHKAGSLDENGKEQIRKLEIFPVTPAGGNAWCLTSISSGKPWLIPDRENLRTQFQSLVPLLAFQGGFVLKIQGLLKALDLQSRFLSESASSITETSGGANFSEPLTQRYRERSKYLFRLIPESQPDNPHIREKFSAVNVFVAPNIVQYWHATLGLQRISSKPTDGATFIESDYAGGLRIYLREGYEEDAYPHELAEHLRNFFDISAEHRDLLAAAITAPGDRVEQLFEARGIAPLLDEGTGEEEDDGQGEDLAEYAPAQLLPEQSNATRSRLGGESRFSRLLGSTRFAPTFFKGHSTGTLPSYDTALDRSARNAMGRPVEPRALSGEVSLAALQGELSKMEFVALDDVVLGNRVAPPGFLDRFRSKVGRDSDAGEAMVSDILAAVLGAQYDKSSMWKSRRERRNDEAAAFTFSDADGRFSAFLMRLDGLPGNAQGYTRLVYHLDVKVTDGGSFVLTQDELDRARKHSVHSQPDPAEQPPSKDVSVLVNISDLRGEPKIRFLTDPWDLFQDGQLLLKSRTTYEASLNLRSEKRRAAGGETGFDSIQIRDRRDGEGGDELPGYRKGKGNGKRAPVKK